MRYIFTIFFLFAAIFAFTTSISEKSPIVKTNYIMLCALNCALAPVIYKLL